MPVKGSAVNVIPNAKYRQRWLAYMDILGYRDLITVAVERRRIRRVILSLQRSLEWAVGSVQHLGTLHIARDVEAKVVADTIYITTAPTTPGGERVLRMTSWMALLLATNGLFTRGAIVRGGHFDDGQVLFSPALVEGYKMEQTAVYPRVLIPDELQAIVARWSDLSPEVHRVVRQDADGLSFVDYLGEAAELQRSGEVSPSRCARFFLIPHKEAIERRWREAPDLPGICEKYEWLAAYHNRHCEETCSTAEANEYRVRL